MVLKELLAKLDGTEWPILAKFSYNRAFLAGHVQGIYRNLRTKCSRCCK